MLSEKSWKSWKGSAMPKGDLVTVVAATANRKTGMVAATYAPIQQTCPKSCVLRDAGCYAQNSRAGFTNRRLEAAAKGKHALTVAKAEAAKIRALKVPPGHPLRLHVTGDCRTEAAARVLAAAADDYRGGSVWTYTHAWRDIPREAWGRISVLASCESMRDAREARARGYVPALIVAEHPEDGRAWEDDNGERWVPCPEQTRGVPCVDCRLCFDPPAGITFAAHGQRRKRVLEVLS